MSRARQAAAGRESRGFASPSRRAWVGRRLVDVVMLVFMFAGAAKLLDLPAFADALGTWAMIPSWSVGFISTTVPTMELLLGGCWFLRVGRRRVVQASLIVLVVFTSVYGFHVLTGKPPDCGCFGRILRFRHAMDEARFVLTRNCILLVMLGAAIAFTRGGREITRQDDPATESRLAGARAFTLVETIVVIAIIGLLVALVLPTLGPIKRKATLAGIASDLKNHVAIFTMYTTDYKGVYPYFTDPDATYTVVRHGDITLELLYYDAHSFWNFALADGYYDGQLMSPSMFPADMNVRHGYGVSYVMTYYYSCNFIASPAFWNKETRTGPKQWRPVRNAQVVYPSKKGLLIDESGAAWGLDDGVTVPARGPPFGNTVGFIDGSARFIKDGELLKGYNRGDGDWWGCFHHGPDPVLHTIGGAKGRDVQ